jgi:hypothetical protein
MKSRNTIIGLLGLAISSSTAAGAANESTTIVLHAQPWDLGQFCAAWQGHFDCTGVPPVINVQPGDNIVVYVLLRNYNAVSGVRYRFEVDGGENGVWGDWTMFFSDIGCLPGQIASELPDPTSGDFDTNFLCIKGGVLRAIALMVMRAGTHGCLGISDIEFSGIRDCDFGITGVASGNRGRICVGNGGYDACDSMPVAVGAGTWGAIKAQYR